MSHREKHMSKGLIAPSLLMSHLILITINLTLEFLPLLIFTRKVKFIFINLDNLSLNMPSQSKFGTGKKLSDDIVKINDEGYN
jgi:hypothetical protein